MTNTPLLQSLDERDGGVDGGNDHEDEKHHAAGDVLRLLRLRDRLLEADEVEERRDDERVNGKETAAHCGSRHSRRAARISNEITSAKAGNRKAIKEMTTVWSTR